MTTCNFSSWETRDLMLSLYIFNFIFKLKYDYIISFFPFLSFNPFHVLPPSSTHGLFFFDICALFLPSRAPACMCIYIYICLYKYKNYTFLKMIDLLKHNRERIIVGRIIALELKLLLTKWDLELLMLEEKFHFLQPYTEVVATLQHVFLSSLPYQWFPERPYFKLASQS